MAGTSGLVMFISCVNLLILFLSSRCAHSRSIIKNLPGFDGPLPFKLETGYTAVGKKEDIELFYYFVESERNPEQDPLVFWINGGPGCSALRPFFYQHGPLKFDYVKSRGKQPVLQLNPYSWTKVSNIIYLDTPVGTGFSYAKTSDAYKTSDTLSSKTAYDFLRKWLNDHPRFISNPLYVAGVSYAGILVPIITHEIYTGNEAGNKQQINIQGYMIGNPLTDRNIDFNSFMPYAKQFALLSGELYESAKEHCLGDYIIPRNARCARDLARVEQCLKFIYAHHILEPTCDSFETGASSPLLLSPPSQPRCRDDNYVYSDIWANDENVRKALRIREGTIKEWNNCNTDHYHIGKNDTNTYSYNITSSVPYHRNLTNKSCRALIYSGDHDMVFPYIGTERWIHSLNLTVESTWAPWFVQQQVAGYETTYSHNDYSLTFATVKGAGHGAPEFKPEECFAMVDRWFAYIPLKWL